MRGTCPVLQARWSMALGIAVVLWAGAAAGHVTLNEHSHVEIAAEVGREFVDLTVVRTYFAQASRHVLEDADENGDRALSEQETGAYIERLKEELRTKLHVLVDGKELELHFRFDPETDLGVAPRVEAREHRVRFDCFARLPKTFGGGSVIAIEEDAGPAANAYGNVVARGKDGVKLVTVVKRGAKSREAGRKRLFEAHCVAVAPSP